MMDVRRIKHAQDREKEIDDQEKVLITKLEAMGIAVQNLPE